MHATSLPALKAFLQGEQYFRRLAWDSAMASYRRALEADSAFALAYRRMGTVIGWKVIGGDSLSGVYTLRAAALNHGQAPRDSLLITAESLATALFSNSNDTLWRAHQARLFSILNDAVQRYPGDPEIWYLLGDYRLHFRPVGRSTLEQELDAFDRAIELDSAYGESYIHPVEIALHLGNPERARRYISGYLKLIGGTADLPGQTFQLVDRLLTGSGDRANVIDSILVPYSAGVLFNTAGAISHWADSLETQVRVARALVKSPPSGVPLFDNRAFRNWWLTAALAFRGRLREAYQVGPHLTERTSTMAVLGGVPSDSAQNLFQQWLREPPIYASPEAVPFGFNISLFDAFPWWAAKRDTAALGTMAKRLRALRSQRPEDIRPWLDYGAASAEAYRALATGDTTGALARFTSLPDTICPCDYDQIVTSQLLSQRGRDREALAVFDGQYPHYMSPTAGLWHLQRARAFEKVGRRDEAIEDYRRTAALWQHADPGLQPYVTEAKQALARLTSEPGT
jgi:serine/threonine-protein kinase